MPGYFRQGLAFSSSGNLMGQIVVGYGRNERCRLDTLMVYLNLGIFMVDLMEKQLEMYRRVGGFLWTIRGRVLYYMCVCVMEIY
jgi:hypothetical protein